MPTLVYRPEIDGLRAIAVLVVVCFHAELGCPGGYVGVDVFFVLSGFLITSLLLRDLDSSQFSVVDFWERRVRRIAPALIATVFATLAAGWVLILPGDFDRLGKATMAVALCGSNFYHWWFTGYFGPTAETLPLLHTWSLAVEEQFYILLPLSLMAIAAYRKPWLRPAIAVAFVMSLGFGIWVTPKFTSSSFFLLPARAWEMLLGSLLAAYSAGCQQFSRLIKELAGLLGLSAIGYSVVYFDENTVFPGTAALLPCVGSAAFLWANATQQTRLGQLLSWKPLVFVGIVSYSFYLIHWPLFVMVRYWFRDDMTKLSMLGLIALAFILAVCSWRFVETPVRKKSVLASRRAVFSASAMGLLLMLASGAVVSLQQGFATRFDPQTLAYHAARYDSKIVAGLSLADAKSGRLHELGTGSGAPACLLWGDSHAGALLPLFDDICRERGWRGYAATHNSTAPLLNYTSQGVFSLGAKSAEYNAAILQHAIDRQIPVVYLAGAWATYDGNKQFEPCLRETIQELIAARIHVVIIRDVPRHDGKVPYLLARASILGDTSQVGVQLTKHREYNQRADELFAQLKLPSVRVIDPTPFFLDETNLCRAELDGKALYIDNQHLSLTGALLLKPTFEKSLMEFVSDLQPVVSPMINK